MEVSRVPMLLLLSLALLPLGGDAYGLQLPDDGGEITVTVVQPKAATLTQQYPCQIRALHHIDVRAPLDGYLTVVPIHEGQMIERGGVLFRIGPAANSDAPIARDEGMTPSIRAPFVGLVGRLRRQQGSFVLKGEAVTTLSDCSEVQAVFNVPEARYLDSMAGGNPDREDSKVELLLSNGKKYPHVGKIGAIGADFDSTTGNIEFRADFPNPGGLLRHGQTGTVLIHHTAKDAIVIPQAATFLNLDRRYVYVVDKDRVAHRREIAIQSESDDTFIVREGLVEGDEIVAGGVWRVHDGEQLKSSERRAGSPRNSASNRR